MRKQKKQKYRKIKKGKIETKKWQLETDCIYLKNSFARNTDSEYK